MNKLHVLFSELPSLPHRVDKKRDKIERKILDSQERAFWDVHRPVVSEITDVVVTFAAADIIADIINIILIVPAKVRDIGKIISH